MQLRRQVEDPTDSAKTAEDFNAAMEKMGELIPAVKKEMEFQAAVALLGRSSPQH